MALPLLKKYFQTLPVAFPLIGLFHIGLTLYEAFHYAGDDSVMRVYWYRPLLLLVYTVLWIGVCFGKKRAALGYIALTLLNVSFHLFGPAGIYKRALSDILFVPLPMNLVFAFLILFFFRKLK